MEKNVLVKGANLRRPQIALLLTVFTVGSLLVAPRIRAAESSNPFSSNSEPFAFNEGVGLNLSLQTSESLSFAAVAQSSDGEESASELNRKLTNPVSSIWSISNQFNNFELNNGKWNNNRNFQPVLPLSLTKAATYPTPSLDLRIR